MVYSKEVIEEQCAQNKVNKISAGTRPVGRYWLITHSFYVCIPCELLFQFGEAEIEGCPFKIGMVSEGALLTLYPRSNQLKEAYNQFPLSREGKIRRRK